MRIQRADFVGSHFIISYSSKLNVQIDSAAVKGKATTSVLVVDLVDIPWVRSVGLRPGLTSSTNR